jgi:hypothetical protein
MDSNSFTGVLAEMNAMRFVSLHVKHAFQFPSWKKRTNEPGSRELPSDQVDADWNSNTNGYFAAQPSINTGCCVPEEVAEPFKGFDRGIHSNLNSRNLPRIR